MRYDVPVWRMVREAVEGLGGRATNSQIKGYIQSKYGPGVNEGTISCHIAICTVNRQSRVNYPENSVPRVASSRYDFLYSIGRGEVELYKPEKHGIWEIRTDTSGKTVVVVSGAESRGTRAKLADAMPPNSESRQRRTSSAHSIWPTREQIQSARQAFEENEPRDIFYRAATDLVALALAGSASLSVAEALAVLLRTWNAAFYRFRRFGARHLREIEQLVDGHREALAALRERSIETLGERDCEVVRPLFADFERVLGPVGAAKSLHLLAPRFFPLWDRAIAERYGLPLGPAGNNAGNYWRFSEVTRDQCVRLGGESVIGRNPLKAIDEYNYTKFTKGWI